MCSRETKPKHYVGLSRMYYLEVWGIFGKFGRYVVYPIGLQSTVQKPLVDNASYGDGAPLFPGGWHETLHTFERAPKSLRSSLILSHRSDIGKQGRIFQLSLLKSCWGSPPAQPTTPQFPEGHAEHPPSCGTQLARRGLQGAPSASQLRSLMVNEI